MHCLEVIVARNDRAAGREEAHAVNDKYHELAARIVLANPGQSDAYIAGIVAGSKEG